MRFATLFLACVLCALLAVSRSQVIDPDYDCPSDGEFEHPDCWKWYNCGEGIAWVFECPGNFLYDVENVWCEYPQNVVCGDRNPRP